MDRDSIIEMLGLSQSPIAEESPFKAKCEDYARNKINQLDIKRDLIKTLKNGVDLQALLLQATEALDVITGEPYITEQVKTLIEYNTLRREQSAYRQLSLTELTEDDPLFHRYSWGNDRKENENE